MGPHIVKQHHRKGRRIVVVQPGFGQGGAEAVAAWILEAVKNLAPITVLTFDDVTAQTLNERYGTSLSPSDFSVYKCRFPVPELERLPFTLLKLHWLMRRCKKWPSKDTLFISPSSEMDFGRPGVQYIDFPQFAERATRKLGLFPPRKWFHRSSLARAMYLKAGQMVSGFSEKGVKENLTLTVSDWTGSIVRQVYGIPTETVYPPVTLEFPSVPFADRENGFVCVGRVEPSKRILEIIDILKLVSNQGFKFDLHIVGPTGDTAYMRRVQKAVRNTRWISLEGALPRDRLAEMIAHHKFGIHGMQNEHFGIAVAEMVKAGCIVFLPNSGGQVEIVNRDERLLYGNDEEAVEKITSILANENNHGLISSQMSRRGLQFSPDHFTGQIREAVRQAL